MELEVINRGRTGGRGSDERREEGGE